MRIFCALLGLMPLALAVANPSSNTVVGRTIYHSDGTYTQSVRDPNTRELTEMTFNPTDVMTVKKVFLLNEKGEPTQGNVYDGRGNLVARCISLYDEFGRRTEDRLINLNGEVFQQVIHEYGTDGKAKQPKVINLNAAAPSIKPGLIDFTKGAAAPQTAGGAAASRFAPTMMPGAASAAPDSGPIYAPGAAPSAAPPPEEKPKPGFFKRLFGRDKK